MKNLLRIFILIFLTLLASNIYSYEKIHSTDYAQFETPIAINPTNPNNIIGATITGDRYHAPQLKYSLIR